MAKHYRVKKNGQYLVTAIYWGRGRTRWEALGDDIQNILKGNLPEQHCQQLITERGDGEFVYEGEGSDSCLLPSATSFGFNPRGAEYTYHYKTCVEIELSAKINDEWTKPSQLASLKGGEQV